MEFLRSISHPEEVCALLQYKFGKIGSITPKVNDEQPCRLTARMCYHLLSKTSRSFSAVIQALDGELRHAVCIFYLTLRALDTVEDDMTIPIDVKMPMLTNFYQHLHEPGWKYTDSSEKDSIVLEQFPSVVEEFGRLDVLYQEVITYVCKEMGQGMAGFLQCKVGTIKEWDEYCHFVAGLVGIGLSRLFTASSLETRVVGEDTALANSLGLFLQKTNIIRDYLEDTDDGREFWPREIWSKYAGALSEFKRADKREKGLECLNELVTNALRHVPDVLVYLSRLRNQSIFNFCAIPQVMAMATLERCYSNPAVFTRVVKIRKGEAVRLMVDATSMDAINAIFDKFARLIDLRVPIRDPSAAETRVLCGAVLQRTSRAQATHLDSHPRFLPVYTSFFLVILALGWAYWMGAQNVYHKLTDSF
ncbi:PREDICTED: squalene synthase-like [Priapulus caudatus]|uniref:Squalene synthase n=1 Tax=Priapulus caudatus TaxID=37621 RepID=A0ABM1EZV4_PRICU|nr:PREDICTED: squalene synthase-like [Priapulus caudatus]